MPYRALGIPDEDVFVHPSSVLAGGPPPEYVVYLDVVRTSRVYIKGEWSVLTRVALFISTGPSYCAKRV